jgi:hypothetical protein
MRGDIYRVLNLAAAAQDHHDLTDQRREEECASEVARTM